MIAKYQKNKRPPGKDLIFSAILITVFLIIIGFLINANLKLNEKKSDISFKLQGLEGERYALEEKTGQLKAQVFGSVQEDYLHGIALERFGLKPADSKVVVITKKEEEKNIEEKEVGFWEEVFNFFKRD